MKRIVLCVAALAAVSTVLAGFNYEGEWGKRGTGDGEFIEPMSVSVAPNGNVYVADYGNERIQYFTPTGSFLGQWRDVVGGDGHGVSVSPRDGTVYTGGCDRIVRHYSATGSLLGRWNLPDSNDATGGEVAPNGNVYVAAAQYSEYAFYYTPNGSLLGFWEPLRAGRVAVAPNGNVYIVERDRDSVCYYTSTGSFIGQWPVSYDGAGVAVGPDGRVFVAFSGENVVRYYTASGSLLGSWGGSGSCPGELQKPYDVALTAEGKRVYVADKDNHRIQYFVENTRR